MKNEHISNCVNMLAMLRKIDELPYYVQSMRIVQNIKTECLTELSMVSGNEGIDVNGDYTIEELAMLMHNTIKDSVYTTADKTLEQFVTNKLLSANKTIEWYNWGTVMLTQYKEEYLNKVRELKPSDVYIQLMHPFCGVQRDYNGDVCQINIY